MKVKVKLTWGVVRLGLSPSRAQDRSGNPSRDPLFPYFADALEQAKSAGKSSSIVKSVKPSGRARCANTARLELDAYTQQANLLSIGSGRGL